MTHFDKQLVPDMTGCATPRFLFINDDILEQKIDDLVDEVIQLELPEFDEYVFNVCNS